MPPKSGAEPGQRCKVKKERLEAKVKELLKEHVQEDNQDDPPSGPGGGRDREQTFALVWLWAKAT
jgi:hypothetical protein